MSQTGHLINQEELMAYLDGEVPVERAASVASHLEKCAECEAFAADLRSVSQQMAAWQLEESSPRLGESVSAALMEHAGLLQKLNPAKSLPTFLKPTSHHLRRWILGLAGGFAALVMLFALAIPNLLKSRQAANQGRFTSISVSPYLGHESVADRAEVAAQQEIEQPAGPMIIRTAGLSLVSKDFDKTRAAVEAIIRRHQGYSAQLNVSGHAGSGRTMSATYRMPADQLDSTLSELKSLASVEQESQAGEEVTRQLVDLNARLSNAQNTEKRLNDVLRQNTGKIADILAVEEEVSRVRGEIERMEAESKNLRNQVQFATLQFRLSEEYRADLNLPPSSTGRQLYNALIEGFRGGFDSAIGLVIFLLTYGPTILFWGLLLYIPSRFVWKRWRISQPQGITSAKSKS